MKKIFFLFLIIVLFLSACKIKQKAKNMSLENKKILMVIAPRDFRDEEFNNPFQIFQKLKANIKIASIQKGTARGVNGTEIKIDFMASEVNPDNFDAVVFIGGPGMEQIKNDETLIRLAQKFYHAQKITAAICAAPSILAKAGILNNKKATSYIGSKNDLIAGGAEYQNEKIVVDGKIITANGPSAAEDFGQTIAKALEN